MSRTRLPPVVPLTGTEMLRGILYRETDREASDVQQPIADQPDVLREEPIGATPARASAS